MKAFVAKFRARFDGETPDAMAALGYDSAEVLVDAIRRAGSTEGPALRDALASGDASRVRGAPPRSGMPDRAVRHAVPVRDARVRCHPPALLRQPSRRLAQPPHLLPEPPRLLAEPPGLLAE